METQKRGLNLLKIITAVMLLLGTVFLSVVSAGPPAQGADPRPGGGGGGGSGGGSGADDDGDGSGGTDDISACASLVGQVINWGFGGEGGVTAELQTGSWQLTTISATDGNYRFGGLGVGATNLHIALSPEQTERLQPLIQDAGVYLSCEFPIVANIALYGGADIDPPATIEMSASRTTIGPGQQANITLTIDNDLPNDITSVVVTDLFPPGLIPVNVSTSSATGAAQIVDAYGEGQLVVVNLDKMATGAQETINITVVADEELTSRFQFNNKATLFYRESVAHQDSLDFTIGTGTLIVPAAAPTATPIPADSFAAPTPESEPAVTATVVATDVISPTPIAEAEETEAEEDDFVPPGGLPKTGDNFLPPPVLLPVTGQETILYIPDQLPNTGLSPVLPLSGLGFAGLAFALHRLRLSLRNKERNMINRRQVRSGKRVQNGGIPDGTALDFSPLHKTPPDIKPSQHQE